MEDTRNGWTQGIEKRFDDWVFEVLPDSSQGVSLRLGITFQWLLEWRNSIYHAGARAGHQGHSVATGARSCIFDGGRTGLRVRSPVPG